jgi:hypothetical protein
MQRVWGRHLSLLCLCVSFFTQTNTCVCPCARPPAPQVLLREPILDPDGDAALVFMVFGGSFQAAFNKPCADFSLRIALNVSCATRPCTHAFGAWEVETMPGHRCMLDTPILPNGKLVLIGGVEEGLCNLDHRPNSDNVPVNEPWIYDPDAPAGRRCASVSRNARGQRRVSAHTPGRTRLGWAELLCCGVRCRYRRTGAFTRIGRFYHGSHLLTSYGDILCSGAVTGFA